MSIKISRYPVCRHILTTGRRCKSLAMTTSAFCHQHRNLRRPCPRTIHVPAAPALIRFAPDPLRDPDAIRRALSLILQGLASGQLPTAPAGRMLSVLQCAIAENKSRAES